MDRKTNEALWGFWNAIRGLVTPDDYIHAALLVEEVKKQLGDESSDPGQAYMILLQVADRIGVRNPFRDRDQFYLAYRESLKYESMNWEEAIHRFATATKLPALPAPAIHLYEERLEPHPETVLIAEAEKFVPNLQRIVDEHSELQYVLTTQNASFEQALKKTFDGFSNVEIVLTDIYRYEFTNRRFDLIFASPIFGGRTLVEDQNFMCREYDLVALENLSLHLNDGGHLVITMPARVTFASGRVNDLRQFIQLTYTIREISELPVGTIEGSAIKMYFLDIENTRPGDEDIAVRRYSGQREKKGPLTSLEVTDDTFVMLSELEEQGDWSVDRVFAQQDEEYKAYQNSGIRKEKIGNVAQVFRGKSVTRKELAGNISVVNISNLGDYEIDYDGLDHLQEEDRKVANYLLQEGDVLLPARGTAIRTAVFHQQTYPCIASSNLIVIRPDPKLLDSTYLKIFLDSPIGNKLINGAQQGMTVMNISYKDLNVLEVPLPTLEKQQATANEYLAELKEYQNTVTAAEKRWRKILAKLQKF